MSLKTTGSKIRPGSLLKVEGRLWRVLSTDHVKPGKGGAFTKAKIQSLDQDKITKEQRFSSSEEVETVRTEEKKVTFLYEQAGECFFLDEEHVMHAVPSDTINDLIRLVQAGTHMTLLTSDEEVVTVSLPIRIECQVEETGPGNSDRGALKPAMVRGIKIMVPTYVKVGDQIVVDSRDGSFIERAKE